MRFREVLMEYYYIMLKFLFIEDSIKIIYFFDECSFFFLYYEDVYICIL